MSLDQDLPEQIAAIREFNRFYTSRLGLLRKRHLDGEFSLTEARILYEVDARPRTTASSLRATLMLDAGYISRLLTALTRRKLIRQLTSKTDARERQLTLTALGRKAVAGLNRQSTIQLQQLLHNVPAAERQSFVASLRTAHSILNKDALPPLRIERATSVHPDALALLQEYYEAVHVVQRDEPQTLQAVLDEPASGLWLAYLGTELVGCVMLRQLASIRHAVECKRLYVKPAARGRHIADKLLDAQEEFARSQGVRWIYLDTYDDLKAAIALYKRRGYKPCRRYNDNPQATLFMRKKLASSPAE